MTFKGRWLQRRVNFVIEVHCTVLCDLAHLLVVLTLLAFLFQVLHTDLLTVCSAGKMTVHGQMKHSWS